MCDASAVATNNLQDLWYRGHDLPVLTLGRVSRLEAVLMSLDFNTPELVIATAAVRDSKG